MRTSNGATAQTLNGRSATKQSLAPVKAETPMEYKAASGANVKLSVALTQTYFCKEASPAEAYVFNEWCAHNGLDPWKREAYLVKYGSNPAQMLTSKEAFTRRAESNPRYRGQKAGVVVINLDGKLENRVGELVLEGEELVGGWADVYVDHYIEPVSAVVSFKERCQYKSNGEPMAKWATSPALMIRKCALVAALREAFPSDVGGMYVPDEMPVDIDETPTANAIDAQFTESAASENSADLDEINSLFNGA